MTTLSQLPPPPSPSAGRPRDDSAFPLLLMAIGLVGALVAVVISVALLTGTTTRAVDPAAIPKGQLYYGYVTPGGLANPWVRCPSPMDRIDTPPIALCAPKVNEQVSGGLGLSWAADIGFLLFVYGRARRGARRRRQWPGAVLLACVVVPTGMLIWLGLAVEPARAAPWMVLVVGLAALAVLAIRRTTAAPLVRDGRTRSLPVPSARGPFLPWSTNEAWWDPSVWWVPTRPLFIRGYSTADQVLRVIEGAVPELDDRDGSGSWAATAHLVEGTQLTVRRESRKQVVRVDGLLHEADGTTELRAWVRGGNASFLLSLGEVLPWAALMTVAALLWLSNGGGRWPEQLVVAGLGLLGVLLGGVAIARTHRDRRALLGETIGLLREAVGGAPLTAPERAVGRPPPAWRTPSERAARRRFADVELDLDDAQLARGGTLVLFVVTCGALAFVAQQVLLT